MGKSVNIEIKIPRVCKRQRRTEREEYKISRDSRMKKIQLQN
jgi:hypothetical protein